jgi:hypothetical protein
VTAVSFQLSASCTKLQGASSKQNEIFTLIAMTITNPFEMAVFHGTSKNLNKKKKYQGLVI